MKGTHEFIVINSKTSRRSSIKPSNIEPVEFSLNKEDFGENSEKPEQSGSHSRDDSKPIPSKGSGLGFKKIDRDVKKTHSKLFNRHRAEKHEVKSGIPSSTFFSLLDEPVSDPFENARESKATFGQVRLLNTAMAIMGLFGVGTSVLAYNREFSENLDRIMYTLYFMTMITSILGGVFFYYKTKLILQLHIYKKEVDSKAGILDVFSLRELILEFLFIIQHPSPFLVGFKWWFYSDRVNAMCYYNINDFMILIMFLKVTYNCRLAQFQSDYADNRSSRVCKMFGCKNDDLYVIKCLLKENPFRYIITGLGAGLLILGC